MCSCQVAACVAVVEGAAGLSSWVRFVRPLGSLVVAVWDDDPAMDDAAAVPGVDVRTLANLRSTSHLID